MMSSSYTNLVGAGWAVNGVPLIPNVSGIPLTGNWFFVDPANGSDGNPGTGDAPLATLYRAHALCTSGNNDVVVLVSNGASTGSARLSTALAQTIDSSATTGTLVWSKNACHLIGAGAPTVVSQRARIAPPTGTYTQATFGSGNFVSVTGSGCIFSNFSLFNGFSTGGTNQICWTDTGGRNYYNGVDFGGMGDAASANSTGSRSLKISTAGENTFVNCTIGLDTVTRTAANASLELSGGTARNTFRNCIFPFQGNTSGVLGVTVAAASGIDRWQIFDNCSFINNVQSTSTTMSGLSTLVASAGGLLLVQNSRMVGITEWGTDATSRGQIYVDMSAPDAAAGGVTTNPT